MSDSALFQEIHSICLQTVSHFCYDYPQKGAIAFDSLNFAGDGLAFKLRLCFAWRSALILGAQDSPPQAGVVGARLPGWDYQGSSSAST